MRPILLALLSITCTAQIASRDQLYRALIQSKVLHSDLQLVHFSQTCTLRMEGGEYPVVDVQEMIKGASTPRGLNRIVVLDRELKPVREIEYTSQRPLFCVENRLYVFGDLEIDNVLPEGNVLTFSRRGRTVTLTHVEANDYPIPLTGARKSPPQ